MPERQNQFSSGARACACITRRWRGAYLDFGAGVAVTSCGHAHPHLVEALTEQAQKIWHTSNLYQMPGQEKLAQRLIDATFADTVFFTNSGAEALECAIKMARKYHARQRPSRALPHHHLRRAPSTAARWPPSPPAARPNISKASGRRSKASIRCPLATTMR